MPDGFLEDPADAGVSGFGLEKEGSQAELVTTGLRLLQTLFGAQAVFLIRR